MKNIKIKLIALAAMIALVLGFAAPSSPVSAAAAPRPAVTGTSYTDCSQSAFLGSRVCVDKTTGYGPIAYIYTNGTSVYTTFSVSTVGIGSPSSFVATPLEYVTGAVTNYPGGDVNLSSAAGFATNQVITNGDVNALNLLNWFANDASYEFVVAN